MKHFILILFAFLFACNSNNLSKDFFQKQIEETILEIESKKSRNFDLIVKFEKAYLMNPFKTGPYYVQAKHVHEKTISVNELIEANTEIDTVFSEIKKYTDLFKSTFIDQDNFIHEQTEFIDRQNDYLKGSNLISKNEIDYLKWIINGKILDLEYETLTYLFKSISKNDFKFNKLEPVLILDKPRTRKGELFTARIGLAAIDSTRYGNVEIKNKNETHLIEIVDGFGIYRRETKFNKTYKIEGNYIHYTSQGTELTYPFEFEYYIDE